MVLRTIFQYQKGESGLQQQDWATRLKWDDLGKLSVRFLSRGRWTSDRAFGKLEESFSLREFFAMNRVAFIGTPRLMCTWIQYNTKKERKEKAGN